MDLEIKDVIELLGVSESTIHQWLSEGKIPAYKMGSQYRFSRSEIEDWLIQKNVEGSKRQTSGGNRQFSLYRALHRGGVLSPSEPMSKEELIRWTMKQMAISFDLDPVVLAELFLDREQLAPTALGHGIAVPHTRDFLLDTHFDVIEVVYPKEPIEFGALDKKPVHTLFFLFASEDKQHLHLLAKLAHLCSNKEAREFLQLKPSKEEFLSFIKEWETA